MLLCLRSGGAHCVQAQSTTPPPVDRTDLARRFYGLREVPPPRTEPLNWQSGDRRSFQVVNSATQQTRSVDAALLFSSTHAHIWADVTATMSASQAEQIATRFDNRIYTPVRALWGQ